METRAAEFAKWRIVDSAASRPDVTGYLRERIHHADSPDSLQTNLRPPDLSFAFTRF